MGTAKGEGRLHYAWPILLVCTLVVFGSLGLGRLAYSPILPNMQAGLGLSNTQGGALATGNFGGYLLLSVIGGLLAARFGPRLVISLSMLVVGLTMILTGLAQSFWAAILWRSLTGMGSGGSNIPALGLLAAWFAPRRRGLAVGIAIAGSSVALVVTGYAIPPVMASYGGDGWRAAWIIMGAAVLLLALLAWLTLRDSPAERGLRPLGDTPETPPGDERASSLAWGSVYRSGVVWHLGLIYIAWGIAYIYITFFNKYLVTEVGLSEQAAGRLWSLVGWLSLTCGFTWGAVSDRWGRKAGLALVYLVHAGAFALFAVADGAALYVVSSILFGLSAWSIPAIMAAACGDQVGPRLAPAALGFLTVFFGIGQVAGPYLAGLLADRLDTFVPAFLIAAGAALLGAVGALLLPPAPAPERASIG